MEKDRFEQAGVAFTALCRIMARLRGPGGCPWDREQTLKSLQTYLLEETYETIDAVENGSPEHHCEELGDLLLQVVFQTEITQETDQFDISDVCEKIIAKLVRRHPHVFEDQPPAATAKVALQHWERLKATEKKDGESCLEGVPAALPALLQAYRMSEKAAAWGFDWQNAEDCSKKVTEEWHELQEALTEKHTQEHVEEEFGDLLFALVNYARHINLDPETSLRLAIKKFRQRFQYVEATSQLETNSTQKLDLDRLMLLWDKAKTLDLPPS